MTVSKITSPISDNEEIDKINEIIDNLGGGGGSSLPPQTGHAGEFLTTDGTDASWAKAPTGRNVGEIVTSTLPLTDAGLHLLDGSLLLGGGIYDEFVQYMADLYTADPTANYWTTEAGWQSEVALKGVCGKFVYDSSGDGSVRLPKITGIIEGTTDTSALGDLVAAGLPNITGGITGDQSNRAYRGDAGTGALYTEVGSAFTGTSNAASDRTCGVFLDASLSNSIYGNSNTVQPQTIKQLVYVVIANSTKTEIEVDIDQIATDLNGKADVDLLNLSSGLSNTICTTPATTISTASSAKPAVIVENYKNGTDWYRIYSDGWCEQGGYTTQHNDNVSITLISEMLNTNYCVQITKSQSAGAGNYGVAVINKSTTSINVAVSTEGNVTGFYWEVKGQGA